MFLKKSKYIINQNRIKKKKAYNNKTSSSGMSEETIHLKRHIKTKHLKRN